jgi:hypothetical protein
VVCEEIKAELQQKFVVIIHSNGYQGVGIVSASPKASLNTEIASHAHHACSQVSELKVARYDYEILQGKDSPQLLFRKAPLARNKAATPPDEKGPLPLGQHESIPVMFRRK